MRAGAEDFQAKDLTVGVEVEVEHASVGVERGDRLDCSGWNGVVKVDVRRVGVAVVATDQGDGCLRVHDDQAVTSARLVDARPDGSGLRTLYRAIGLVVVRPTSATRPSPS